MSGHSKWSTIKRQKGVADAKRSQVFTKLAKAISVAARDGADPTMNSRLRLAIDKAREQSMPKDNIERAIQKGSGSGEGTKLEEVRYEGYGPGGVAFLIEAVSDNRNRTGSQIRHLLEKFGGHLGGAGSVAWLFETKGVLQLPLPKNRDELELALIEAGASDIQEEEDNLIIICEPQAYETVKAELMKHDLAPVYASVELVAKTTTEVGEKTSPKLNELREALDNDDDVTNFYDSAA